MSRTCLGHFPHVLEHVNGGWDVSPRLWWALQPAVPSDIVARWRHVIPKSGARGDDFFFTVKTAMLFLASSIFWRVFWIFFGVSFMVKLTCFFPWKHVATRTWRRDATRSAGPRQLGAARNSTTAGHVWWPPRLQRFSRGILPDSAGWEPRDALSQEFLIRESLWMVNPAPVGIWLIHVYLCLSMFIHVYPFLSMFIHVYPCLFMFIHVYPCLSMFIHVYPCLSMFIHVYPCLSS